MILCEFTPSGGSLIRISTEDKALAHQWYGYILGLDSIRFELKSPAGGYAKPSFSDLRLSPEMFEDLSWPPEYNADVIIKWTEDTEANAVTLFEGTATLNEFDRNFVSYALKMPEFDYTITESPSYPTYSDTLANVFTSLCSSLSLTLNTDDARGTSPSVSYTVDADQQAIDMMAAMAEFFTHAFYVSGGTLYLVDMLGTDTASELTEDDFTPARYRNRQPVSLVQCNSKSADGSDKNGDEIELGTRYSAGGASLTPHLENYVICIERDTAEITCPITDETPRILDYVTLYDESTIQPTTFTGRVISVLYNFDSELAQLEISGAAS